MSGTLLSCVVGLLATVSQPADDPTERLLQRLDSPVLVEREDAERALFGQRSMTIEQIGTLARRDNLSPEQKFRLRKAARGMFERRPHAGMGVQFQGESPDGVAIGATIPGFPAHLVLQPGDVIAACDGRRMRIQEDLQKSILSRDPGDVLELEIVRNGVTHTVQVRLGSFADLSNARTPEPQVLTGAFALRWARTVENAVDHPTPIGAGVSVEQWAEVEAGRTDGERGPPWPLTRDSASRLVSFGGLPRSALATRRALANLSEIETGATLRSGNIAEISAVVDRIRSLNRQRIVVDQRAQTLETHADMVADPARRQQLLALRQAALQEALDIDRELAKLAEALRVLRDMGR